MTHWRTAAAIISAVLFFSNGWAMASGVLPERKLLHRNNQLIEFSAGDEAYASALANHLPLDVSSLQPPSAPSLPVTIASLREKRAEILNLLAERLALSAPTADMEKTFDSFVSAYSILQSVNVAATATKFALWRKPELEARLNAGQSVAGFSRTSDGEIEFSAGADFEILEREAPEKSATRMRESWSHVTWPLKIVAEPALTPEAEIQQRIDELRQNVALVNNAQSAEIQSMAVMIVLHETIESTVVKVYLRSPDRRWFCEGVANYVAFKMLETLVGPEPARAYYDVNAEVAKYAGLQGKVSLSNWPVMEDPKSHSVPADVNRANYAFATKVVFEAFEKKDQRLLAGVLREVRKTPVERADINTVLAAYQLLSGMPLKH